MPKRILQGKVVSDKGDKTVVVDVVRKITHPIYRKIVKVSKRYAAHDADNKCREGDIVKIEESKPFSKTKKWQVVGGGSNNSGAKSTVAQDKAQLKQKK